MNIEQAEKIDQILALLKSVGKRSELNSDIVRRELKISEEEAKRLIEKLLLITFEDDKVVQLIYRTEGIGATIKENFNTQKFITAGGYVQQYNAQLLIQQQKKKREKKEEQKLQNDLDSFKITKKQYRFTKRTAIFGLIIAISSILLQVYLEFCR